MAAVALEIVETALLLQQELQTLAVAVVVVGIPEPLVVLELSSFVMPILLRRLFQPLALLQLQLLEAIAFTNGLLPVQSHSKSKQCLIIQDHGHAHSKCKLLRLGLGLFRLLLQHQLIIL
jgi:hypothetical protein